MIRSLTLLLLLLSPARAAGADRSAGDSRLPGGPVKTRELLPPYLVFLSPLPEEAELLGRGVARFEVSASVSNSFAGTRAFRSLNPSVPGGRLRVDRTLIDSFRAANPGRDLFYIDGEVLWTGLIFRLGVHERLDVGVDLPLVRYAGGAMDSLVENFHHRFDFPDDGRPDFERDVFDLALFLGSSDLFLDGPPSDLGIGDLTLTAKTALVRNPARGFTLSGAGYLKLPTGSEEKLLGSGSLDAGFQILLSHRFGRQAYHLSGGFAWLGDWDLVPGIDPANLWFGSGTYEIRFWRGFSYLWQTGFTASPFRDATGGDLADPSLRINSGFRWTRPSGLSVEWMMEENFTRTNSSADFGFHVGLNYRFGTVSGKSTARRWPPP